MTRAREFYLAQLRHLYSQMVRHEIGDMKAAADGLLAPAIREFEQALPPDPEPAPEAQATAERGIALGYEVGWNDAIKTAARLVKERQPVSMLGDIVALLAPPEDALNDVRAAPIALDGETPPAPNNFCACGHTHQADTDGADGGCRTCDCGRWRPMAPGGEP